VLLIGPTGAGKSATANALLGLPGAFVSRRHVAGVTQQPAIAASTEHCALRPSALCSARYSALRVILGSSWREPVSHSYAGEDGLRAIDTPGLADPAITEEQCHEHIRTAVALAGDAGVDVVLVVLSLASRLTDSLTQALSGLVRVLGPLCLSTRTLVVWTHADLLQADGVSVPQVGVVGGEG
jgi:predicted GTPase